MQIATWGWDEENHVWVKIKVNPDGSLVVTSETALDQGVATGGSIITLVDTTKDWEVNMWADAVLEVVIAGVEYHRTVVSNTADTLTFNTLPVGVVVAAGNSYSLGRVVSPLNPLARAEEHNVAGYVATADILAADLAPINTPCLFRLTAGLDTAGILSVDVTRAGVTVNQQFNHGVVLVTNALFMFDHLVHAGDTINYQYSVNCTIQTFRVQEIVAAVQ